MNISINNKFKKIINFIIILTISILIFKFTFVYLAPFILGYILCIILNPIVEFLVKNNIHRSISSLIAIFIFLLTIFLIGTGIIAKIIEQAKEFSNEIPYIILNVKDMLNNLKESLNTLLLKLPDGIRQALYSFYNSLVYVISDVLSQGVTLRSVDAIKKIPNFFMIIIVGIVSCFFMLSDKQNIENFISSQIPIKIKNNLNIIKQGVLTVIFGYIKAQAIIMLIISIICFLGLTLINVKYSLLLCFIIAFLDALPILGSGAILLPWGIYCLITKSYSMSAGIFILYIVIFITRQSLEHKILGKQIGVHPLATLVSIYVGLKLFGFIGIFIGPIIVVTVRFLQQKEVLPNWK